MKKLLSLLMVLVLVFAMAACQSEEPAKEDTSKVEDTKDNDKGTDKEDKEDTAEVETPAEPVADLNDARVRQAIAYAIDMDVIVEGLFEGKALATNSLTPPSDAMREENLMTYTYNPEKAKELLEAANWDYDYELDVVFYYGDQQTIDLMTAIQAYLADVGMKMSFRKVEGDVAAQLWTSPEDQVNGPAEIDWDLCYGAVAALTLHDYYNRFGSTSNINSHTPTNAVLDEQIEITNTSNDFLTQMNAFKEIQKIINSEALAIPLYHQQLFIYESTRLDRGGYEYGNDQYYYDWGIADWTLDGSTTLKSIGAPIESFPAPFLNPSLDMPSKLLFDRLILPDATLTPSKPMLANNYEMSSDGLTLTLDLRDDVKWHDGEMFDAQDVAFTLELLATVPTTNGIAKNAVLALEGAQEFADGTADSISGIVIDGNSITMNFKEVNPNVLVVLSQWPILPEHLLGEADPIEIDKHAFWQSPVGTGLFKVDEVSLNDFTTFVRNDDYYMDGTGNIEVIQLTVGGEKDGNLPLSAEAGAIDFAFGKSVPEAKAIEVLDNMTVTPVDIRYTRMIYVNKFPQK